MAKTSAGVIPYHLGDDGGLEVFIVHMGGPYWSRRDAGGWSLVKGEYDAAAEDPREVAAREFAEEVGVPAPAGPWLDLDAHRMPSGKVITAYAVAAELTLKFVVSNTFEMEWPRGSRTLRSFPEVDRAHWWPLEVARAKLVGGQVPILDRLAALVGDRPAR